MNSEASQPDADGLMLRALELAARGEGAVEPNPMVGAIVLDERGTIVGEGWHESYGGPHAEVHALRAAGEKSRGGTLIVTLEPCCHQGKTPPCTEGVIQAGIRRVIVGMRDPFPAVAGKGIERLRAAGIEVEVGMREREARELNRPFTTLVELNRPYVHAKWAMTWDGKTASRSGSSKWISNEESRGVVHDLRRRMDGILVGIGTVREDDPLLTARPAGTRSLLRIVLDPMASMRSDMQLLRTPEMGPVMVVTGAGASSGERERLTKAGAEVLVAGDGTERGIALGRLLEELGKRKLTNLLVEGGSRTLGKFFDAKLVDETHVFVGSKVIGGEEARGAVGGEGIARMEEAIRPRIVETRMLGGDVYLRGRIDR